MANEQKPKITSTYFIFSALVFVGVAVLTVIIEPQKKTVAISSLISILPFSVGTVVAMLTRTKEKRVQYLAVVIGAIIILSLLLVMTFEDVASLIGLYIGGYWVSSRYLKK